MGQSTKYGVMGGALFVASSLAVIVGVKMQATQAEERAKAATLQAEELKKRLEEERVQAEAGKDKAVEAETERRVAEITASRSLPRLEPEWGERRLACTVDADCAVTQLSDGECCSHACAPGRVESRAFVEAMKQQRSNTRCEEQAMCPTETCLPPCSRPLPRCVAGRCKAEMIATGKEPCR